MPRRQRGARRRPQVERQPFDRSPAEWRALGAPPELYDVEAAAAAEVREHGAILEGPDPGPPGFYAARWWRRTRAEFLAAAGALTGAEARLLARRGRPQTR